MEVILWRKGKAAIVIGNQCSLIGVDRDVGHGQGIMGIDIRCVGQQVSGGKGK